MVLAPLTQDPATHDTVVALLDDLDYKSADVPIEAVSAATGGGGECGAGGRSIPTTKFRCDTSNWFGSNPLGCSCP
jgi:hypothetical protein